ncbi:MAG: EAL domain-containing protein [Rhizobacter sp.]
MSYIGVIIGAPKAGGVIWTLSASALRIEAARRGLRLTCVSARNVAEQAAWLERLVEQGADVLAIKPLVTIDATVGFALDKVYAAAVPVITIDSTIDHPAVVCNVGTDGGQAQRDVSEYIFKLLNGRGKVMFLRADSRPTAGAARNASFDALLKIYPDIELVGEGSIDWVSPVSRRKQGFDAIQAALVGCPQVDAIIATNDEAALGAIDAMLAAGRPMPLVSGFDGLTEALMAIREKRLTVTVRQLVPAIARSTLDVAQALIRGESCARRVPVPVQMVTFDNAIAVALESMQLVPSLVQELSDNHEQQRELQQEKFVAQSRVLKSVVEVSDAVGSMREPRQMTQAFVNVVHEQFELHGAAIFTWGKSDEGGDRLQLQSSAGNTAAQPGARVAQADLALFTSVMGSGQLQLFSSPAVSPAVSPDDETMGEPVQYSRLVVPLQVANRVIGVLDLQSEKADTFDRDTVKVLEAIARLLAATLENANLYAETVRLAANELRDSQAKAALAERAQYLSNHDVLTGLPNRRLFNELLEQAIVQARRDEKQLAVLFLDLDRFKQINDTVGHHAGDELLKQAAVRLKDCLRESDTVARLGGDEFVVLLREIHEEYSTATVARKIIHAIAQPFMLIGHEFRVTGSVGIALYPEDGLDEQTLTKHADIAMYHAKKEGKNNFQFYSQRLNTNSLERMALEAGLRRALERNEFRLYYQAKRDMQTSRITGMEVLLRWQHPELGLVLPMQFLPVAEETGLIVPIGNWVIRAACQQNMEWQRQGLPHLVVSVNVTTRQFADDNLLRDLKTILAATGMEPNLLELEATERTLIRDNARTLQILGQLREAGIRIAIDDFGMGYSSLSTLRQFPLDAIKIDRSFVSGIDGVQANPALAHAIIAMGRSLSLTVVAQGVETQEQADFLRTNACDEFQGFYFNAPVSADEFTTVLQRGQGTC